MAIIRIFLFVAGVLGGIFVSPWIPATAILLLSLPWRAYEAIFLGFLIDLFWLPTGQIPFFTLGAIIVVWVLEPLRRELLA